MNTRTTKNHETAVDRRCYLESDEFATRMTAHVRTATSQAAEEYQRRRRTGLNVERVISTVTRLWRRDRAR